MHSICTSTFFWREREREVSLYKYMLLVNATERFLLSKSQTSDAISLVNRCVILKSIY